MIYLAIDRGEGLRAIEALHLPGLVGHTLSQQVGIAGIELRPVPGPIRVLEVPQRGLLPRPIVRDLPPIDQFAQVLPEVIQARVHRLDHLQADLVVPLPLHLGVVVR